MRRRGELSRMAVPLKTRGRVIGVVELSENRRERQFTADELATAETLCGALALAIDNAELYGAQELERHRLASLLDVSRAIASTESLDDALAIVAQRAAEGMGVAQCIAYEFDAETDEYVCRATWLLEPIEGVLGSRSPLAAEERLII